MEVLAIIPARGGSKGLPNKNILPLLGHPLIAYSIKAAIESNLISRVIVSTDSEKIAKISRNYGAETPFLRPSKFAKDLSTDLEVFDNALLWLKNNENYVPDLVVQLRPTSPLRKTEIIDKCIEKISNSKSADSLRIVTPSPITPYKMWTINDDNDIISPLLKIDNLVESYNQPRQKLPQTYWQIGFLDVIKTETIIKKRSMSGDQIMPFVVDNEFALDIDEMKSFNIASELLLKSDYVQF